MTHVWENDTDTESLNVLSTENTTPSLTSPLNHASDIFDSCKTDVEIWTMKENAGYQWVKVNAKSSEMLDEVVVGWRQRSGELKRP